MDLPPELRIEIAKYAMSGDEPLKWTYTTYNYYRKVGTFKCLDQLTSLRRVSKQLYQETSGLAWKCNEYEFDGHNFGVAYIFAEFDMRGSNPVDALFVAMRKL